MRALLVTSDTEVVRVLGQVLDALGTRLEVYSNVMEALASARQRRFDAVFVDPGTITRAAPLLSVLRDIATHRKQLVVSILEPTTRQPQSHSFGSDFVLWKPLNPGKAVQFLRAAYGLIVTESARYFRHPVEAPAMVSFGIEEFAASMTNVSAGGACLRWHRPNAPRGPLRIRFVLPGHKLPVLVEGEVVWTVPLEGFGIRFTHIPELTHAQLERWLAKHLPAEIQLEMGPAKSPSASSARTQPHPVRKLPFQT